ncbi:MAG: sigma 54-interacting transcriptional regulator [Myxococcota bacterium]|nr:sigma 54-interacting transcriptional regulator [Myxococcota bacterium]
MPCLVWPQGGPTHFIARTLTTLGSGDDNDFILARSGVADHHAHIRLDGGRFVLVAASRSNPVYVNGKKSRKTVLEHGDSLQIGEACLTFNLWDEASSTMELQPDEDRGLELDAYRRLGAFSERLATAEDIDALFEHLLDEVIELTGAGKGFFVLNQEEGLTIKTARNLNRESFQASIAELSDSIVNHVIETHEPVIISDALTDTLFKSSVSVVQLKLCSVMCVPLLFGGQLLGVLYVGNDNIVSLFEQKSLDILTIFASQAALLLAHAMKRDLLVEDNARLRVELEGKRYGQLIGDCAPMRHVFARIEKIAPTDINVLIRGETGTGKELIAREIHRRSTRSDGPFVAVNCGAIPEELMESVLFGHKRGAFTGAVDDKLGCFQAAERGTLFLDEIGEMSSRLQVKLLRAIQERTITRVGEQRPRKVNIRLLTATHVDLDEAIRSGMFREDLYYRINVVGIDLPPLRNRGDDAILLTRYFIERIAEEYDRPPVRLDRSALEAVRMYPWPGNVRQLQNRLKKAVVLSDDHILTADDLDLEAGVAPGGRLPLNEAREQFVRDYIDASLERNGGNRSRTARELGVDPRTIFRHLERWRSSGSS